MKKLWLFAALSLLTTDSQASQADPDDNELYLVVGSSRKARITDDLLTRRIGEGADFTHRKTFGGKAITLSEHPSNLEDLPHIVADPRTFRPKQGQVIKAMFLELLPSLAGKNEDDVMGAKIDSIENPDAVIYKMLNMSRVLENLSKFMVPGATLEIEHWPHASLGFKSDFYIKAGSYLRQVNPFACILSPYFPDFIMARNLGNFDRMLYWNIRKQELMAKNEDQDLIEYTIWESTFFSNRMALSQAVRNLCASMDMSDEELEARLNAEYNAYLSHPLSFYNNGINTISLHIMQEYSVLTQKEAMKSFIENLGYEQVVIENRDNPINGRKDSWMISAIKKMQRI